MFEGSLAAIDIRTVLVENSFRYSLKLSGICFFYAHSSKCMRYADLRFFMNTIGSIYTISSTSPSIGIGMFMSCRSSVYILSGSSLATIALDVRRCLNPAISPPLAAFLGAGCNSTCTTGFFDLPFFCSSYSFGARILFFELSIPYLSGVNDFISFRNLTDWFMHILSN